MKYWAEACKSCKTHQYKSCGLCKNASICKELKTDYCFDCADAEFCRQKETEGWRYINGRWEQ